MLCSVMKLRKTTRKITHLYPHISPGKNKKCNQSRAEHDYIAISVIFGGKIDVWIIFREWGLAAPQVFPSWIGASSVGPMRAFILALAAREDWSEGYKWPPSNCLTETQHIRPRGWHNLGLIHLPWYVCNPISPSHPRRCPSPPQPLPPAASSAPETQSMTVAWIPGLFELNPRLKAGVCSYSLKFSSLEPTVKVMRMYIMSRIIQSQVVDLLKPSLIIPL